MIKVRFLEGCYVFSTGNSYDPDDIVNIDEGLANRLSQRGVVDILKDEEYIKEDEEEENLESLTVAELREIAEKNDIVYSGLRKAELIEAIKEVL